MTLWISGKIQKIRMGRCWRNVVRYSFQTRPAATDTTESGKKTKL